MHVYKGERRSLPCCNFAILVILLTLGLSSKRLFSFKAPFTATYSLLRQRDALLRQRDALA